MPKDEDEPGPRSDYIENQIKAAKFSQTLAQNVTIRFIDLKPKEILDPN